MIKKELHFVWITKDGKKFLNKDEATEHQKTLLNDIVDQWFNKIKGEQNGSSIWIFISCTRYGSYYGYCNRIS